MKVWLKDNDGKIVSLYLASKQIKMRVVKKRICRHVYKWDDLIKQVIKDKLDRLGEKLFVIPGVNVKDDSKLVLGKGLIYKLMYLLQGLLNDRVQGKAY